MTTIRIGTTQFPSIAAALRAATADSVVLLGSGPFSPGTLAGSTAPRVTVRGSGATNATILKNTRVFSRSSDGGPPPTGFTVQDLRFDYDPGSQGYILSPSTGSLPYNPLAPTATGLSLINLSFTGSHRGTIGANGTYLDLSGSKNSTLNGVSVSLSGQVGYDPLTGTGGGYFLFFEGGDNLQVLNSRFNEAGYSSTLIVLFTANAQILNNQFIGGGINKQSSNNNPRGERFYNAGGLFNGNTLSAGAFFDFQFISADPGNVWTDYKKNNSTADGTFGLRTSVRNNSFDILGGSQGILIRSDAPAQVVQTMLTISGNTFNNGVAIRSRLTTPHDLLFAANTVNGVAFDQLRVGGEGNDQLNLAATAGLKRWISGGGGNDQLFGSPGSFDAFVFSAPLNAQTNLDTIFGFETSGTLPDEIWLDRSTFFGLQSANNILSTASFSANATGLAKAGVAQITYNTSNGLLAFDPDGTGPLGATSFARLNAKESLNASRIRLFGAASPPTGSPPRAGAFTATMLKDAPGGSSLRLTSLITVGEVCTGLPSSSLTYLPPGRFDGLGAYDNGDGTITVLVNHELGASDGYPINVAGLNANVSGARISRFVIAKDIDGNAANGFQPRVLNGGLAYDEVRSVDPNFAKGGLTRLCSANLSEPFQFGGGKGFVDRLYFTGEESGPGRFFALDTANTDLYHVAAFGRGGWESAVAVDTGSTNTVALMLFDDTSGTANHLYLWVGTKAPTSGDLLRRNGIDTSSGALYAWKAETINTQAGLNAVALNTAVAGHWERLGSGTEIAALPTAGALRSLAQAKGAMAFVRIEDGDVNPSTGKQVAFNTTGGSGADLYGNTNLIELSAAFASDGSLRTTANTSSLKVIVDADRLTGVARQSGVRNPDNIAWGRNGKLYIQEDRAVPGGTANGQFGSQEASIWEVDPLTGSAQRWAQIDRTAVPSAYGQSDSQPADIGNWEPSGLIEVSQLFGAPAGTVFLTNVMAHSLTNGSIGGPTNLVEGGQLQLIQVVA